MSVQYNAHVSWMKERINKQICVWMCGTDKFFKWKCDMYMPIQENGLPNYIYMIRFKTHLIWQILNVGTYYLSTVKIWNFKSINSILGWPFLKSAFLLLLGVGCCFFSFHLKLRVHILWFNGLCGSHFLKLDKNEFLFVLKWASWRLSLSFFLYFTV